MDNSSLLDFLPHLVAGGAATIATISDVRWYKIPNRLTFPLCLAGLAYHTVVGGLPGLRYSGLGLSVGLGVLFWLYLIGAFGAGDVKLLAGVGAWLGAEMTFHVFLVAALASGLYAIVVLVKRGRNRSLSAALIVLVGQLQTMGRPLPDSERVENAVQGPDRRQRLIPFGAMVAIGVAVVSLGGWRLDPTGLG